MRQALPTPGPRVSLFRSPAARQVPPLLRASVPPLRPSARQLLFPSAHQVTPILIRASATIFLPRVRYPPTPIRASATIPLPRVRYPPSPSARQLLSFLPRVRYASGAPHSRSARQPFSKLLFALPRVSASVPLLLPSARQLLFSFRASGNPHPHPCVSYYTPSARQVPPTPIPRQLLSSLPRIRYPRVRCALE